MDRFAAGMTARGPTLAADGETWTGSLHIVDLPDDAAARAFVEHEPYNRAGLFEDHFIRRFDNLAGRDMWQFPRGPEEPRFLVIARHRQEADDGMPAAPCARPSGLPSERLIFHGELHPPKGPGPAESRSRSRRRPARTSTLFSPAGRPGPIASTSRSTRGNLAVDAEEQRDRSGA